MRLIDADNIEFVYLPIASVIKDMDAHYETVAFKEDIDVQPTVEAIPVHFIEEQILLWESLNEKTLPSFYYRELIELWKDKQNDKSTVERTGALD